MLFLSVVQEPLIKCWLIDSTLFCYSIEKAVALHVVNGGKRLALIDLKGLNTEASTDGVLENDP